MPAPLNRTPGCFPILLAGSDPESESLTPKIKLRYLEEIEHMAHVRQSRPDFGLTFQGKVLETFRGVTYSLGRARNLVLFGGERRPQSIRGRPRGGYFAI